MKPSNSYSQKPDILVVDDTPANLQLLASMLKERGYKTRPVPSGMLALQAALSDPPDLILLDIHMPEMDGYQVCQSLKADERLKDIPVIFISALTEVLDKVKAFSVGGVDYITKPFQVEEVKARVETHLEIRRLQQQLMRHNRQLGRLVQAQVKKISDTQMAMIFALAKLAESRDDDSGLHLERVQAFCGKLAEGLAGRPRFGRQIDAAFIENICHASPLHDIGKVAIPDRIVLKPGKLTPEEFEVMKTHASLGAETLEAVQRRFPGNAILDMGIAIARFHHEKWNGQGYPQGLAGEAIPLCARIMAVADVYETLRAKRCYKPAFSHEESMDIIVSSSGTHFDPEIVKAFLELREDFRVIRDEMGD
ncbi:MAG: response regulator [Candidatus Aminicenantes bacterium]|nr:response regulator [Candidatus Aminicenantes bacterium]